MELNKAGKALGRTPLYLAVIMIKKDVVQLLLDRGADQDVYDTDSSTPLHWGANLGHLHVAKSLLDAGAKLRDIFLYFTIRAILYHLTLL